MLWQNQKISNSERRLFEESLLINLISSVIRKKNNVKLIVKKLFDEFSSLDDLVHADEYKLSSIINDETEVVNIFHLLKSLMSNMLLSRVVNKNVISSNNQLLDYLKFTMGGLDIEQFRILFLNKKNILLADDVLAEGTIDQVACYPREIIKRALFHGAGAIIIVHNHPSTNPKPSEQDLEITNKIVKACKIFNISVHDHLIIAKNDHFSCLKEHHKFFKSE